MTKHEIRERLLRGNLRWRHAGEETAALRRDTAENGQHPYAIVIACSDSRVIPEQIFDAGLGELFVIRGAGNVLDRHQLGSVEYAAAHLDCHTVGLRADGSAVATGANATTAQASIQAYEVRPDGSIAGGGPTTYSVYDGRCDVSDWTQLRLPE
ncbi:MAG: carbonic anhydrase [Clostridia bacterium]